MKNSCSVLTLGTGIKSSDKKMCARLHSFGAPPPKAPSVLLRDRRFVLVC